MDIYSIYQESYILLITVYGGMLIGFIYDIYRVIRGFLKPKKLATMIQDSIFWLVISTLAFYLLIVTNNAAIRYYNFLGFILGIIIYQGLLSKIIIKALIIILRSTKRFLVDLYQILIYPLRLGLCLIMGPYSYCKSKLKPLYYRIRRLSRLPFRIMQDTKRTIRLYIRKNKGAFYHGEKREKRQEES